MKKKDKEIISNDLVDRLGRRLTESDELWSGKEVTPAFIVGYLQEAIKSFITDYKEINKVK